MRVELLLAMTPQRISCKRTWCDVKLNNHYYITITTIPAGHIIFVDKARRTISNYQLSFIVIFKLPLYLQLGRQTSNSSNSNNCGSPSSTNTRGINHGI